MLRRFCLLTITATTMPAGCQNHTTFLPNLRMISKAKTTWIFCFEGEEQFLKAAAYYEREHVTCCLIRWGTTPNCCSLRAILESGCMCAKPLLPNFRLCTCRDPRRVGKSASRKHFFQFYHFANEQRPETAHGDWRWSRISSPHEDYPRSQ